MADDFNDTFLPRLQESELYKALTKKCRAKDSKVIGLVDDAVYYAFERTKTIISHMGEYTLHDADHLFRVLHIMEKLLQKKNIKQLSIPELMLLILSAFFHDIGMAPDLKEVLAWKKIWDTNPEFIDDEDRIAYQKFKIFYSGRPDDDELLSNLVDKGELSKAETLKSYLVTEFIRMTHAERARTIISKDWNKKIVFRNTDITVELAQICYSHNEDAQTLLDLDMDLSFGNEIVACLPLIAIILRLSDILDFDGKRTPNILYSHLYVRHPVSIAEWNKHREVNSWDISPKLIQFNAKCTHPAIEASIRKFCDLIDKELSTCYNLISVVNENNQKSGRDIEIKFPFKVNRSKIVTEKDFDNQPKYIYRDTHFTLSKTQVVELLMGTKLYGDPQVALRELIQNSIDACLLRLAQENKWQKPYTPEITVKYYDLKGEAILEVTDNGTGMDQHIIDNYYSKVGSSFYKSDEFYSLKAETNGNFIPTSRFGIGILSCFMVADTLIVDTKKVYENHRSSEPLNITVEGQESIFWIKKGSRTLPGTTTKLVLRKNKNPWEKMTPENFLKSVESVIPNPPFKINIQSTELKKFVDQTSFKKITSASLKDKSWGENENIKVFEIVIDKLGVVGSASVAVLEEKGMPVKKIDLTAKEIDIDGNKYTLEKSIRIDENIISEVSKSISINDKGEIRAYDSTSEASRSKSQLSLHGIEVPTNLFRYSFETKKNHIRISWPFPLILVIDVCGERDLDLNSPRTEILLTDKWISLEEDLAFLICQDIANQVSDDYWNVLKTILEESSKSNSFLNGLKRVEKDW
ncbi:ATP-binding protein [Flavobacterium sp.]|uniref:HD domain-containing protein n=1 Tax=Flavobacterium sp. TaxID=239 RepID=UPI0039E397BD